MKIEEMIKNFGEPIVKSAFNDIIPYVYSSEARKIIKNFSKKWKDYSRPFLMMLACKSVGGNPEDICPIAKSFVLIGGGIDIHDDIIDSSYFRTKKMKKTLLGKYGLQKTLLIGDSLLMGGLINLHNFLINLPKEKSIKILEVIRNGIFELGSAEIEELKLIRNLNVTPRKYLKIVYMKAADVECYTKIGGIIGGGSEEEINSLGRFGRYLGMIAILRDDIEDTFYDDYELISRITKESLPFPIVVSLKDSEFRNILQKLFNSISQEDINNLKLKLRKNKSFGRTKRVINSLIKKAKIEASKLKNPSLLLSLFKS